MPRKKRTIGSILKKHREDKKLTQLELADASGLDRSYIGHIELDNRLPTVPTFKKLAKVLGVEWTELVV